MSHLPLSLLNRLNKTESAVFILWMLYFQRISFQIMLKFFPSTGHFKGGGSGAVRIVYGFMVYDGFGNYTFYHGCFLSTLAHQGSDRCAIFPLAS